MYLAGHRNGRTCHDKQRTAREGTSVTPVLSHLSTPDRTLWPGGLHLRDAFAHGSSSWKSKVRGAIRVMSGEDPLPGLQTASFSSGEEGGRETRLSGVSSWAGFSPI